MGLKSVMAVGVTGLMAAFGGVVALSSGTGCAPVSIDVAAVAQLDTTITGFSGDQLVNAALIMNAATAAGMPQQAQVLGVMMAIGESGLRNLTHGDDITGTVPATSVVGER